MIRNYNEKKNIMIKEKKGIERLKEIKISLDKINDELIVNLSEDEIKEIFDMLEKLLTVHWSDPFTSINDIYKNVDGALLKKFSNAVEKYKECDVHHNKFDLLCTQARLIEERDEIMESLGIK